MFLIPIFVVFVIHIAYIFIVQTDYRAYSRGLRLEESELLFIMGYLVAILISLLMLLGVGK